MVCWRGGDRGARFKSGRGGGGGGGRGRGWRGERNCCPRWWWRWRCLGCGWVGRGPAVGSGWCTPCFLLVFAHRCGDESPGRLLHSNTWNLLEGATCPHLLPCPTTSTGSLRIMSSISFPQSNVHISLIKVWISMYSYASFFRLVQIITVNMNVSFSRAHGILTDAFVPSWKSKSKIYKNYKSARLIG